MANSTKLYDELHNLGLHLKKNKIIMLWMRAQYI
jgi:hypothetical protein